MDSLKQTMYGSMADLFEHAFELAKVKRAERAKAETCDDTVMTDPDETTEAVRDCGPDCWCGGPATNDEEAVADATEHHPCGDAERYEDCNGHLPPFRTTGGWRNLGYTTLADVEADGDATEPSRVFYEPGRVSPNRTGLTDGDYITATPDPEHAKAGHTRDELAIAWYRGYHARLAEERSPADSLTVLCPYLDSESQTFEVVLGSDQ